MFCTEHFGGDVFVIKDAASDPPDGRDNALLGIADAAFSTALHISAK